MNRPGTGHRCVRKLHRFRYSYHYCHNKSYNSNRLYVRETQLSESGRNQFNSVEFSTYHLIQHTGCPSVSHDYALLFCFIVIRAQVRQTKAY
jgi:hypothetical protein